MTDQTTVPAEPASNGEIGIVESLLSAAINAGRQVGVHEVNFMLIAIVQVTHRMAMVDREVTADWLTELAGEIRTNECGKDGMGPHLMRRFALTEQFGGAYERLMVRIDDAYKNERQ